MRSLVFCFRKDDCWEPGLCARFPNQFVVFVHVEGLARLMHLLLVHKNGTVGYPDGRRKR